MNPDETTGLSHEAEQDLRSDIKRDAARTRDGSFEHGSNIQKDAETAESQLDDPVHHDAY